MKKKILIILSIGFVLTVIAFIGRYTLLSSTLNDFFMQPIRYKTISIITSYSFTIAVLLFIPFAILLRKIIITNAECKSKKIKSVISDLSMGLMLSVIVVFLLFAFFHSDREGFTRHEAIRKHVAMDELYDNLRDAEDILYFSEAVPFEWDALYVFTHELKQHELLQYVDNKTYTQFNRAFDLLDKIQNEEGKSVFCIFNDGKLLVTYDLGVDIYESVKGQNIIYFKELSPEDAVFQVKKDEDEIYIYNLYYIADDK